MAPQAEEVALNQALLRATAGVHACLLDSINLVGAMEALFELVRESNRYMDAREGGSAASPPGARPMMPDQACSMSAAHTTSDPDCCM